jgi:hypothetical protein
MYKTLYVYGSYNCMVLSKEQLPHTSPECQANFDVHYPCRIVVLIQGKFFKLTSHIPTMVLTKDLIRMFMVIL